MKLKNFRIQHLGIAGVIAATALAGFSAEAATRMAPTGIRPGNAPDETQRLLQERGYGMFIHFGMNTFIEQEWSEGVEPATTYNPTELDCDQWVRVARDAGFRYVLLVTKHHDGFCLWDSKLTDYDVASSGNPTDVVGAVAEACRKYGLKFGIYYSLWDRHEPTYTGKNFNKYVDYMCGQLTELLTNYGDVCELWLDGAWDKPGAEWDIPRLYNLVKKYQPNCAFAVNGTIGTSEDDKGGFVEVLPDRMTDDNIFHMRYFPGDVRLWDPKIASRYDHKQYLYGGNSYYLPFEHTICLSKEWNWFQKEQPKSVRDLDELEELFYWTTSNGNTLVINIPPDRRGKIMEHEAQRAIELRQRLGIEPGKPLPMGGKYLDLRATATSQWDGSGEYSPQRACDGGMQTRWASNELTPSIEFTLDPKESFDKITIFEYCDTEQLGDFSNRRVNRIREFNIQCEKDGTWETIYVSDTPIGDCRTIRLPYSMNADKIRMNITAATAPPSLYEFSVIDTKSAPASPVKHEPSLRSAEGVSLSMPYSNMALSGEFVRAAVSDKDWYIWCFSPLMCPDGKVHAFCSRWPATEGMEGWIGENAEIAHYVSDSPEGPFKYVATVMKSSMFPDRKTMSAPHNPRLEMVDGKYVLLYICQDPTPGGHRQRIGMMIADSIDGPWHFAGENGGIMVEAQDDDPSHWTYQAAIGADNPAFLKICDKYYIYYKCGTPAHMDAKYGYAVADRLEGPYHMCDAPITDNISYLEDAQAFEADGKYYLLTTDNLGGNTGGWGYLILWESEDGKDFRCADASIAMGTIFDYWGTPSDKAELLKTPGLFVRCNSGKLERPAILKINGRPAYLYAAGDVNINGGSVSEPYIFRIDWKKNQDK